MASPSAPKRFALLVGVDLYLNNGARKFENGQPVSLRHLEGAANDVNKMKSLLQDPFKFNSIRTLTCSPSPTNHLVPNEPTDSWPTYNNIKRELDNIYQDASPGDMLIFHYSGHGALLQTTEESPQDGRQTDASLMTADYCCGELAIRGWELNKWLRKFNEKGIRIIVLLDTCFSGGAWRDDRTYRSPGWNEPPPNNTGTSRGEDKTETTTEVPPPNNTGTSRGKDKTETTTEVPQDQGNTPGQTKKPGSRDGDLDACWDFNPKDLTLMTACRPTQKAAEQEEKGVVYGAFTLAITKCLQDTLFPNSTYQAIRDRTASLIESWDLAQNPQAFGQDRLVFLGDYEPISSAMILGRLEEGIVSLPVGKIHGIGRGAEFAAVLPGSEVIVSVSQTSHLESKASITKGSVQDLSQFTQFIPCRWSSEKTLKIIVDPKLGSDFQNGLSRHLSDRIAGDIQYESPQNEHSELAWLWIGLLFLKQIVCRFWYWITGGTQPEVKSTKNGEAEATWFRLSVKEDRGIEIFGPQQLLGNQGPVCGWEARGETDDEKARESAAALAHLFRFGQIVHLRSECDMPAPFQVTIEPAANARKFKYKFLNCSPTKLQFSVFILGPGFDVDQLFPSNGALLVVSPRQEVPFSFELIVPDKLKEANGRQSKQRDIIRTIVIAGEATVSLRSMELPHIWESAQWGTGSGAGPGRDARLPDDLDWWIQDEHMFTN
ncbi:hypothetical protein NUW58_g358 [Xylaria curta]|uniref:Uncharacterized protein n=1 Tax=Xylaria curta TaxID=42375 RepID=A0ACC1PPP2_9PEZI|nr:hypothetical protein NUW58_g358 [Xylaria curta]